MTLRQAGVELVAEGSQGFESALGGAADSVQGFEDAVSAVDIRGLTDAVNNLTAEMIASRGGMEEAAEAAEETAESFEEIGDAADEAGTKVEDAGKKTEKFGKSIQQGLRAAKLVIEGVGQAFDLAAQEAEKLGRVDVSRAIGGAKKEFGDLITTLVQIPIAGRDFLDWMGDAAEGFTNAANLAQALTIQWQLMQGVISQDTAEQQIRELTGALETGATALDGYASRWAAFGEGQAIAQAAADQEELNLATLRFTLIMGDAIGNEMEAFNTKQGELRTRASELSAEIKILAATKPTSPEQIAELEALQGEFDDVATAIHNNVVAHEEATARILFSYAQQALAIDGLTLEEISALAHLQEQWGLVEEGTAAAVDGVIASTQQLADDKNPETFAENMDKVLDAALRTKGAFPLNLDVNYNIRTNGTIPDFGVDNTPGGNPSPFGEDVLGPGGAGGRNFIVPPGYSNDSYLQPVSSGEHVIVVPRSEVSNSTQINLTAQYPAQSERSLAADVRMLQMMTG